MSNILVKNGFALFWSGWPSNWHPSPFSIQGTTYNCVEQWMMAEKARCFGDSEAEKRVMSASDPFDQKRFGRAVRNYNDKKWADVRYMVVLQGTLEKYRQNPHLRAHLLDPAWDGLVFVEASPDDRIWGIGREKKDPLAWNRSTWLGTNLLGQAITEARGIMKKG